MLRAAESLFQRRAFGKTRSYTYIEGGARA